MADAQPTPTLITSVVRALTLLDAVGSEDRPVTAKRLSRVTRLPPATTYHLLRTLTHEGYLARHEGGYVLGQQVAILAARREGTAAASRDHEVLAQLHDETKAAAYLSVLEGKVIRLVDVVDSPAAPRTDMWVRFEDAAHATALGKAVLAALPLPDRRDYLASHPLEDLTPATVTSRRVLLEQLEQHPEWAVDDEEYALGTRCLAVPLPTRGVLGAVAISVPSSRRGHLIEHEPALRRAAALLALHHDG
jgi:DNA-binding IclR family transcriptional regulator